MSNIIFHKLFNIKVKHEYFADSSCDELCIVPAIDTDILMQNYGILFKQSSSGGMLAQEVVKNNGTYSPKIDIEKEIKLRFYLILSNSAFFNYTDMEYETHQQSIYYFNNQNPTIIAQEHTIVNSKLNVPIQLHNSGFKIFKTTNTKYIILEDLDGLTTMINFKNDQNEIFIDIKNYKNGWYSLKQFDEDHSLLTSSEIYIDKDIFSASPFGIFEVSIDENYDLSNPVDFIFNFKSRPVIWRYKIFKKDEALINGGNNLLPVVVHEETGPDKINFTAPSGDNPIVVNSTSAIKLKETGIENINLKKNNKVLISNLPNASTNSLKKEGSVWLSDIYVYYYV